MQLPSTRPRSTTFLSILILTLLIAAALYIWRSWSVIGNGFPLDDAWIHQTYARNLAERGEWAFLPGESSAGSTAPIWTILLSLGYLLSVPNVAFSYFLGLVSLLMIVWLVRAHLADARDFPYLLLILLLILISFEWHLLWAALSGMETLLLGMHLLIVVWGTARGWHPAIQGALVGLGLWIRPDGILTLLPVLWVLISHERFSKRLLKEGLLILAGLVILAIPYLYFNFQLGGEWWPSTFYAKQVEYAAAREAPLLLRLINMSFLPFIGPTALLLPGIVYHTIRAFRTRDWTCLAILLWIGAYIAAFAVRLPVTYQHGRYMIPLIPALFLLGFRGLVMIWNTWNDTQVSRILKRVWILSLVLITFAFWVIGADAYATDVAIIETEMVATAEWIAVNTQKSDLIAAHDIGALGYFADRRILDLAGLISPEVIPIMRNEIVLEAFLNDRDADFLMTFPGWYPQLTAEREAVFSSEASFSPSAGGENMKVYRWP